MNGLPYYKAYPRDFFEGTVGMDFEVKAAYRLILDMIYLHGGRLVDDPRFIAGLLGCSGKKWAALRHAVLATGKISLQNGYLANDRADKLLDETKMMRRKKRDNVNERWKNKRLPDTVVIPNGYHTEPDTDKKDSEAIASAEGVVDFSQAVFSQCVAFLVKNGKKDGAARAVVGKWRKNHSDRDIFDAFAACSKAGVIDPIPWITARLKPPERIRARLPSETMKGHMQ